MKSRLVITLSAVLVLCGCKTTQVEPSLPYKIQSNKTDQAEIALAEAAVSVSQSLSSLAEIERANAQPNKRLVEADRYHIPGIVSIDWSGPIEPFMRKIAEMSHYHLRVLGKEPPVPVVVTITATDTPLTDILRDVDFQAGKQANVYVSNALGIIELRYKKL